MRLGLGPRSAVWECDRRCALLATQNANSSREQKSRTTFSRAHGLPLPSQDIVLCRFCGRSAGPNDSGKQDRTCPPHFVQRFDIAAISCNRILRVLASLGRYCSVHYRDMSAELIFCKVPPWSANEAAGPNGGSMSCEGPPALLWRPPEAASPTPFNTLI